MSPILLDHGTLKKLWISMTLALVVVFLSGYVVGFKKAEVKLATFIDTVDLELPATVVEAITEMEPQLPELAEPGESIDVDSVEEKQMAQANMSVENAPAAAIEIVEKAAQPVIEAVVDEAPQQAVALELSRPLAIGGPSASDPEQGAELLIQDTATEETALYSIQVGMYGQLDNAERKVEELITTELSAYVTDYMNRKNEIRYNVRFGYFAGQRSAKQALVIYMKEFSGSGYVVRLKSPSNAVAVVKTPIESKN